MRGQKQMSKMKRGQTIVAERERIESDSERLREQKKLHRKRRNSVICAVLVLTTIAVLMYTTGSNLFQEYGSGGKDQPEEYVLQAQIVDEDNRGQISTRIKNYIMQLEQDFKDLGYVVTQVILPTGTSRELYVDLADEEVYFKVNTDRDAAVTAEDADRVLRYLKEHDLHPQYADVRIAGRAYYK